MRESGHVAACAAERDMALLKVRALSARVEALREKVAGDDIALLEGGEREAACAAERDEALLEVGVLKEKVAGWGWSWLWLTRRRRRLRVRWSTIN